jgi:hypothetical protein
MPCFSTNAGVDIEDGQFTLVIDFVFIAEQAL